MFQRTGALDTGGLTSLAEALQFLSATTLTRLLVVSLATHLLAETATFTQLAETTNGVLDRFAGTDPELHHNLNSRGLTSRFGLQNDDWYGFESNEQ